jgi:protocatechuate 3,4-dioxygenase beta subunit
MTKTEAADVIAREVVRVLLTGRTDGRDVAQEIVAEWHAGHQGAYRQDVARTNGYECKDIARVTRAAKARIADLQAAARDRATAEALAR